MLPILAIVVAVVAALLGLLRWLRVSQREHYISGQVLRTARRWVTVRPPNQPIAALWLAGTVVAIGLGVAGFGTAALAAGTAAGVLGAVFPFGMSLLGKVRLRLTRRARTQGLVALVLLALVVAGLAVGVGGDAGLGAEIGRAHV
jgi:UDP-N-acetylmuramoyl-tripeptide--D-alanyl-D-alanine ligase